MRHQARDVSLAIANSRDIRGRTVRISGCIVGAISAGVAEDDLPVFLQLSKRGFVASVIPVAMRNGDFQDLPYRSRVCERRVRLLDTNVAVAASNTKCPIVRPRT